MARPLFGTPDHIKSKAVEVLRLMNGMSYADAMYALEVAQRSMQDAVERLHEEQVFSPPVLQNLDGKEPGHA